MVRLPTTLLAACGLLAGRALAALEVNLDDKESIKKAAALVAEDLLTFYRGDEPGWVPGILPGPPPDGDYYWWQGGAMWGALLDYRHTMGDTKFDDTIYEALLFQVGPNNDFMPPNWTASMGNDDQAFWAYAALLAAETGFRDPPADQPQWLALAQAVFNEQTHIDRRVEGGECDWGLRWQVYRTNNGFDYINTVANACYFNIGARLAHYTGNNTYSELAERTYQLIDRLGYISDQYDVYDGAHLPDCKEINKAQFSYNAAMLMQGAAFMYNVTNGNSTWETRLDGLADGILRVFFAQDGVAFEPSCERPPGVCNADMESYRGYMHRWMANSIQLAPKLLYNKFMPTLKTSTAAGVKQCTGGANGRMCGFHWTTGKYDGLLSASLQMNVLGALTSLIMPEVPGPLTNKTGGTSKGDPDAGLEKTEMPTLAPITTGDKAGASILTILIVTGALSAFAWMSLD
ncbi:hypothetical protein NUW58_g6343 [Xylaria curta]|uniref:Uncharacterized protein n=1 Tax=Xylaria curta TaxID=42375 RepID=A0ACC1NU92_9PEZI|nr:hypothetical protein NUW58_g6343 [Xylaria curta]